MLLSKFKERANHYKTHPRPNWIFSLLTEAQLSAGWQHCSGPLWISLPSPTASQPQSSLIRFFSLHLSANPSLIEANLIETLCKMPKRANAGTEWHTRLKAESTALWQRHLRELQALCLPGTAGSPHHAQWRCWQPCTSDGCIFNLCFPFPNQRLGMLLRVA